MKRQDKLELAFASLIAVAVIVLLIFAIAIVSPEQGVLQETQSTPSTSIQTSVSVFIDTITSITTQTPSTTITYTQTSIYPQVIISTQTLAITSITDSTISNTASTRNQLTSQSTSTFSSVSTTSALATTSATSSTSTTTIATTSTSSSTATTTSIDTTTRATTSTTSIAWGSTTLVSPSGTSLSPSCSPSEFQLGKSTLCTATVTSFDSRYPATGQVSFSSTLPGSFSPPTCTLQGAGPSSCSSTFTPKGPATGYYTVTQNYLGDVAHTSSSGSVTLIVPPPEATLVSCFPNSLTVGSSTNCIVAVNNTVNFPSPTGTVAFTSNMPGSFGTTSCTLNATGSCSVHYTPAKGSAGLTTVITATYDGDLYHAPGSGTSQLTVT